MNTEKLEQARKRKGITIKELCKEIGISRSAYYRKCRGISEFKKSEMEKIIALLELPTPIGIFFMEKVS